VTRILRHLPTTLSTILFLSLLLFWIATAIKPRAIWWNHAAPFPHYHFATIRNGRLMLAHYRETAPSPMFLRIEVTKEQIKLAASRLDELTNSYATAISRIPPDQVQVSQARGTLEQLNVDLMRYRTSLNLHDAHFGLPPNPRLQIAILDNPVAQLNSSTGNIEVSPASQVQNLFQRLNPSPPNPDTESKFLGLSYTRASLSYLPYTRGPRVPYAHRSALQIPLVFLLPLLLILPAIRLVTLLKSRRRRKLNLCPTCAYDLRASPIVCPECGSSRRVGLAPPPAPLQ
jgi:hypothetical protein